MPAKTSHKPISQFRLASVEFGNKPVVKPAVELLKKALTKQQARDDASIL